MKALSNVFLLGVVLFCSVSCADSSPEETWKNIVDANRKGDIERVLGLLTESESREVNTQLQETLNKKSMEELKEMIKKREEGVEYFIAERKEISSDEVHLFITDNINNGEGSWFRFKKENDIWKLDNL